MYILSVRMKLVACALGARGQDLTESAERANEKCCAARAAELCAPPGRDGQAPGAGGAEPLERIAVMPYHTISYNRSSSSNGPLAKGRWRAGRDSPSRILDVAHSTWRPATRSFRSQPRKPLETAAAGSSECCAETWRPTITRVEVAAVRPGLSPQLLGLTTFPYKRRLAACKEE